MFKTVNLSKHINEVENEILEFWKKEKIFKKSLEGKSKEFRFYDGPPFVSGMPHHGSLLSSILKDVVPRYKTMQGYRVERRFGWDCHGLPIEHMVEKKLNLSGKKDIEEKIGIEHFCNMCLESIEKITNDWQPIIDRIARWVDFDNDYKTLDRDYMESELWVFKQIYDKGLIFKDSRISLYCKRCTTPLTNFEVTMDADGYRLKQDKTVTVLFEITKESWSKICIQSDINVSKGYILAWTTTPWTLPSNFALAVGPDIEYVCIKSSKIDDVCLILAKNRLNSYEKTIGEYQILAEFFGKDLVGYKYIPLFDYFVDIATENTFTILPADFVTTDTGTGVVHIAPSFGEDDYKLGKEYGLPMIYSVDEEGKFDKMVKDFANKDIFEANKDIIEFLKEKGHIFEQGTIDHNYPHCYRCKTPLIYKLQPAYYIDIASIKDQMLKTNENINWIPEHIKHGRFENNIKSAPQWCISRNRYWGVPIPIWECNKCKNTHVMGSIEDIVNHINGINFVLVRHGESVMNVTKTVCSFFLEQDNLTELGINQVKNLALKLKDLKIDEIFVSPLKRTIQTADILKQQLNFEKDLIIDNRLIELDVGKFNLKLGGLEEIRNLYDILEDKSELTKHGIESIDSLYERLKNFVDEIYPKYQGKTVVIVSHASCIVMLSRILGYLSKSDSEKILVNKKENTQKINKYFLNNAEFIKLPYHKDLLNYRGEIDIHKHVVDKITYKCEKCKDGVMIRTKEILDVWFDSGSMPYAQLHYPFENKELFEKSFPADYVVEYVPQTRGWFYNLHVLSNILFNLNAFKNCLCHGTVLGNDGDKISKSKGNFTPPMEVIEKYGADAFRIAFLNPPLLNADNWVLKDSVFDEMLKSYILPLRSVLSFFTMYANVDKWDISKYDLNFEKLENPLDIWIISLLHKLGRNIVNEMEKYAMHKCVSEIIDFIDNLTNWYVRRSRRRFWKSDNDVDKMQAYNTLYYVMTELSKLIAPFTPYIAEEIYQTLVVDIIKESPQSVHLCNYPDYKDVFEDYNLISEIYFVRQIVSLSQSLRAKYNIKLRQPLSMLKIYTSDQKNINVISKYKEIIKEESNVKDIEFVSEISNIADIIISPNARILGKKYGPLVQQIISNAKLGKFEILSDFIKINTDQGDIYLKDDEYEMQYKAKTDMPVISQKNLVVSLDINITKDLFYECIARDIIRYVQEMRKKADYNVSDRILLSIKTNDVDIIESIAKFEDLIKGETLSNIVSDIEIPDKVETFDLDNKKVEIKIGR